MGLRSFFDRVKPMPEVEETIAVPDEVYVIAGSLQEYKAYKRSRRQYRNARYVSDIGQIRGVRKALIIFTGTWTLRYDGVDLWESAKAGGNQVEEDFVL